MNLGWGSIKHSQDEVSFRVTIFLCSLISFCWLCYVGLRFTCYETSSCCCCYLLVAFYALIEWKNLDHMWKEDFWLTNAIFDWRWNRFSKTYNLNSMPLTTPSPHILSSSASVCWIGLMIFILPFFTATLIFAEPLQEVPWHRCGRQRLMLMLK